MDWYYAVGGERFGPFDQEVFEQLVSQGRITGVTLVWRDGLDDWVQYQLLAGPTPADPGDIPPALVQCSQCRRQATSDDMVQYQGHWVCSECKDTFYQRVREGSFSPQDPAGWKQHRFAGFWIRVGAAILDGLILFVAYFVLGLIASSAIMSSARTLSALLTIQFIVFVAQVAIFLCYVTWFWGKFGATPGKMACGLKVVVPDGRPISYWRAFGRGWAMLLSLLITYILVLAVIFVVALTFASAVGSRVNFNSSALGIVATVLGVTVGLAMFFPFYMVGLNRQKCALHDFICNTRVIHAR